MKNNFWGGLSKLLYFFGFLTLIMELIVFSEFNNFSDGPYWSLGAAVIWLLFFTSITCFIVGANLKNLPVPEKYKEKTK